MARIPNPFLRGTVMSSIFVFLTVVQAIVAALLVGVILMQKSEGGGLGVGGSPTGLISARGAADLLTRMTAILAVLFVVLSVALAAMAVGSSNSGTIDDSLNRSQPAPVAPSDAPAANPLGAAAQPSPNASSAPASDPLGTVPAKQ